MDLTTAAYIVAGMTAFALAVELGTIAHDEWHWRKFRRAVRADRKRRNAEAAPRVIDSPTFAAAIRTANAQLSAHRHAATAPSIAAAIQQARPALPDLPALLLQNHIKDAQK